jgi:hypothetical protein
MCWAYQIYDIGRFQITYSKLRKRLKSGASGIGQAMDIISTFARIYGYDNLLSGQCLPVACDSGSWLHVNWDKSSSGSRVTSVTEGEYGPFLTSITLPVDLVPKGLIQRL